MPENPGPKHVAIIGGGFTGLAAGYELGRAGHRVTVIERDPAIGGLAGSFEVDGVPLEKFYHHWFNNDRNVMDLVDELGQSDQVLLRPTRTGMYYSNNIYRLSKPTDVLRFKPLPLLDRFRLGLMVLRARRVKDWRELEGLTAAEWLRKIGGDRVYEVVWEPLLRGKFGSLAEKISAVWFWNKLVLRGGSRGERGEEMLAYYRGGFVTLAARVSEAIVEAGGTVLGGVEVTGIAAEGGRATGVHTSNGTIEADAVLVTTPLPIAAQLLAPHTSEAYVERLNRIDHLANICLVLVLDRSLSSTYWLNVNDPNFPFVGVIEHTNFEPPETYHGKHIVYLSKYLPVDAELYRMTDDQVFEFALPHLRRMFPDFRREWVLSHHTWRARYAQPVVGLHYSRLIPEVRTPVPGLYLATMAQIYPEDRGTNYAIREGRLVAREIAGDLIADVPASPTSVAS